MERKAPHDLFTHTCVRWTRKNQKVGRTSQQTQEILHRDFVPAIVDFDVLAVEVECVAAVCEHTAGEVVARITGRIIGEHKDDVRVGYTEALHGAIPVQSNDLVRRWHSVGVTRTFLTHLPYAAFKVKPLNARQASQSYVRGS